MKVFTGKWNSNQQVYKYIFIVLFMDSSKREIRFLVSKKKYEELKTEAKELNVPVASLIKLKLGVKKNAWRWG